MRPTTYCKRCGEYCEEQTVSVYREGWWTTARKLVHIDGDRNVIHRAHAALTDD